MDVALTKEMIDKNENISVAQAVKKYSNQLFSYIKGKVNSLEDAEDILQEVWYQFSRLSNLDTLDSITGWLYSVSRNKITDQYRKKKIEHLEDYSFETDDGDFSIKDVLLIDDSQHPELKMFKELFWEELIIALNELPENQKQVFVLNEMEDNTLQEIANTLGENLKTIISRKGYAVKHLRKKLLPLYQEFTNQ